MNKPSLYEEVLDTLSKISPDSGGGSPLSKCYLMVYLIKNLKLKTYVEIGVYKGRSLFAAAAAIFRNDGKAYGIDPYNVQDAYEDEVPEHVPFDVNSFLNSLDFNKMYSDVLAFKEEADYGSCIKIIRQTSDKAIQYLIRDNIVIDMLHIDGNHDCKFVELDVKNYCPKVKDGGIIVFDDINWPSVRGVYEEYKKSCYVLFETEEFGILVKRGKHDSLREDRLYELSCKTQNLFDELKKIESKTCKYAEGYVPTVCVGILSYNHDDYIEQCLQSVIEQRGHFYLKVVISDDCSKDRTISFIQRFIESCPTRELVEILLITNHTNIGVVKNLQQLIQNFAGCDYFTFCEGDDYWSDGLRIEKLLNFMKNNPEYALSFNKIQMYFQNEDEFKLFDDQKKLNSELYTTGDIVVNYFIGNLSACFYNGEYLSKIDPSIFDIFTGDWFFNTYYSTFGDIGYYNKVLSVYRKHDKGFWTGLNSWDKIKKLASYIDDYNEKLNFTYDKEYTEYKKSLAYSVNGEYLKTFDLLILDSCFPLKKSMFRFVEFNILLEAFESIKLVTDGSDIKFLCDENEMDVIREYKKQYPRNGSKVEVFSEIVELIDYKLLYIVFLNNAYKYLDYTSRKGRPFVFTLYPGGGFAFDNFESDRKLRKVMSSPCFKKVIVSQKPVYDYLIEKKFCQEEQIEYIFGVVTETDKLSNVMIEKSHYGLNKNRLDICFVAFKYTPKGSDKGYDIFVDTAKILCQMVDNVYFHVVGNFDKDVIDVAEIKDRITFYGTHDIEWFDDFYKDKDIILSPNQPGKISKGAFDGFPTTACIDAGLRETAIFCTDPMGMNDSNFLEKKEIIIISNKPNEIVEEIMYYYNNPVELKKICNNGRKKIIELYSFEKQIISRINLLTAELLTATDIPKEYKFVDIIALVKRLLPNSVKSVLKKILVRV